jgi:ferritin-like metal-binding protein YciE
MAKSGYSKMVNSQKNAKNLTNCFQLRVSGDNHHIKQDQECVEVNLASKEYKTTSFDDVINDGWAVTRKKIEIDLEPHFIKKPN